MNTTSKTTMKGSTGSTARDRRTGRCVAAGFMPAFKICPRATSPFTIVYK
jgi:hypothetical protein